MFPAALVERASALVAACKTAQVMLATAESCTGGLISGLLTEVPAGELRPQKDGGRPEGSQGERPQR